MMKGRPWYTFGSVAVQPTRYGTIVVDVSELPVICRYLWHVRADRAGKHLYVRAWLDSRRASGSRGKAVYLHALLMQPDESQMIDFVNGNGLDCRRDNLRFCTKSQDNCNRHVARSNTGKLGVHFSNSRGKFVAQIRYENKARCSRRFETLDEAVEWRDCAAEELHREFASLNRDGRICATPADGTQGDR